MKNENDLILERLRGVPAMTSASETDSDHRNPNVRAQDPPGFSPEFFANTMIVELPRESDEPLGDNVVRLFGGRR